MKGSSESRPRRTKRSRTGWDASKWTTPRMTSFLERTRTYTRESSLKVLTNPSLSRNQQLTGHMALTPTKKIRALKLFPVRIKMSLGSKAGWKGDLSNCWNLIWLSLMKTIITTSFTSMELMLWTKSLLSWRRTIYFIFIEFKISNST